MQGVLVDVAVEVVVYWFDFVPVVLVVVCAWFVFVVVFVPKDRYGLVSRQASFSLVSLSTNVLDCVSVPLAWHAFFAAAVSGGGSVVVVPTGGR